MNEIERDQFYKLEDLVVSCDIQKVTGELEIKHDGEGRLYKNKGLGGKKWFRSIPDKGVYLADPALIEKFL